MKIFFCCIVKEGNGCIGLYHFGERYYNPTVGRWTQQDPLAGSLFDLNSGNRYVYANDDPVNATDPSGKVPGNCGSSFVEVQSGTLPGNVDIYFSLDSSWGAILFFSITITVLGPGGSYNPIIVAGAPGQSFYDDILPAISTGSGFVAAVMTGFALTAQGYCAIYDSGYGYAT